MKLDRARRAFLGGFLWAAMGLVLVVRGVIYGEPAFAGSVGGWLPWLLGGAIMGAAKGLFVLSKTCKKMLARIEAMPGREWFWQIYPPRFLFTIPLMIGMGIAVRTLRDDHPAIVLAVYVGIGAALLFSSLPFFGAVGRLAALDARGADADAA